MTSQDGQRARMSIGARGTSRAAEPTRAHDLPKAEDEGRLREQSRGLANATPPKLRAAYARAFCADVLARFWAKGGKQRTKHPLRVAPTVDGPAPPALRADALALADALAEHAVKRGLDDAGYLVGRVYASMLPDDVRSTFGVFYTPPPLASRLLDLAEAAGIDWTTARVLDPACGGGAFLGPVARRMVKHLRGADRRVLLRNLGTRLHGYEIDPFSAWLSAVFLDATLIEELGIVGGEDLAAITACDALSQHSSNAAFDLVVGNPPYGRITLDADLRSTYKRSLFGHANLYGVFLDLALRRCTATGSIAFVTPTSFLSGEYFRNLRSLLAASAPPVSLDFVAQRAGVFDDVLQETILAVFRVGSPAPSMDVHFLEVSADAVSVFKTEKAPVPADDRPWIVPRTTASARLAARLRSMPTRLADWGYRVSTGPLVWNRFKPRLKKELTTGAVPLIWAEAVSADGEFAFRAARRNHAPYFVVKPDEEWLLVRKPCVLLQRTTAKEQPRRLIAAELPQSFLDEHGAVTVENHLNMLLADKSPEVPPSVLAAFLNSAAADAAFRCISGSVAVSAYELEAMPLPLASRMRALTEAVNAKRPRTEIEKLCARLYEDA